MVVKDTEYGYKSIDFGKTREDGYGFLFDYQCFGTVFKCKDCGFKTDAEHFIVTKKLKNNKRKIIPVTCPSCYGTNITIEYTDER